MASDFERFMAWSKQLSETGHVLSTLMPPVASILIQGSLVIEEQANIIKRLEAAANAGH